MVWAACNSGVGCRRKRKRTKVARADHSMEHSIEHSMARQANTEEGSRSQVSRMQQERERKGPPATEVAEKKRAEDARRAKAAEEKAQQALMERARQTRAKICGERSSRLRRSPSESRRCWRCWRQGRRRARMR